MISRLAAHFIFPLSSSPIAKGMIEVDSEGTIVSLYRPESELTEMAGMIFYNGILCPGFPDLFNEFPASRLKVLFPQYHPYLESLPKTKNSDQRILEWMKAIQFSGTEVSLEDLLRQFIFEPAVILNRQHELGTFDTGKRPGVMLIERPDYNNLKLSPDSRIKRLI